ncbi:zinc finger protein [Diplodia corticola]|uniref:Zinc finger protein n=1 Tax=Diplodia corticola TaxID=236234 RepID=A0A1J9QV48_9PEZI|nr:zinc finger protein [Diplodia corticola]OJD31850.1 zinc finger protein [Diplodia corticola]
MYDYECDTCDRDFASQRACDRHMDDTDHWIWEYECDTCTARFSTEWLANEHMDDEDHWSYPYDCETCSYSFRSASACDEHMDDKDHWSYPYDCETCSRSFRSASARDKHQDREGHYKHLHCKDCDKYFRSEDNLRQHRNSRLHRGATVPCPFCKTAFTTASGVSHHLETSSCPRARNLSRTKIYEAIKQRDPDGIITERLVGWATEPDRNAQWDPKSAWNGHSGYECYVCHKVFSRASGLRSHVFSPVHQAPLYHCPNKHGSCRGKKFPTLAALFNHLESQTCDFIRFEAVGRNIGNVFTISSKRLIEFSS